ncbi:hypothetical protein [Saliphagus sp. LR7]|uniref:hypothetical protein n=1 Tax=Saliphagus sp. LR7 TaxID=2282654 RepID=UPI0013003DCD|nr:hypothetical protein [Saliphagus sp. LR7]
MYRRRLLTVSGALLAGLGDHVTLTDELNGDPTVTSSLWYSMDTRLVEAARE